jgi:hypothetical protein
VTAASAANGQCRACLKRVIWARTEPRNRWFPLDPKPDPKGNQAAWQDSDGTWRTRQIAEGDVKWDWETVYMPHVATCEKRTPKPEPAPLPQNVTPISAARSVRSSKRLRRT